MIYNINEFNLIPNSIKLEIIKEKLLLVYELEIEAKKYLKDCQIDLNLLSRAQINRLMMDDREKLRNLTQAYINFEVFIERSKITDDEMSKLYYWAKITRKKLGLSDNLFNVFEGLIYDEDNIYEKINKNISEQNCFKL